MKYTVCTYDVCHTYCMTFGNSPKESSASLALPLTSSEGSVWHKYTSRSEDSFARRRDKQIQAAARKSVDKRENIADNDTDATMIRQR